MAPDVKSILPEILNRLMTLTAANAIDKEPIERYRIYIAPPDNDLLIE